MNRNQAKEMLPIIQAFADGKVIQMLDNRSIWTDLTEGEGLPIGTLREEPNNFRIKPEPKYIPFKNAEECLAEMQKHQLFGWVKNQDLYRNIANVMICSITFADNEARDVDYEQAFKNYTFADGTPFGVKVEE